ncbi:MAG: hypothetical protein J6Y95_01695 [Lachnospiraceae bacterium]|nr:hypothetical protein [Lachnospiraceae bacterium]
MRILLTNDDGIRGEGLRILASWARKLGEIVVYAPKTEQSACGQSITLRRPFSCVKSGLFSDLGIDAYEGDSTPADCVRIAYCLNGPFDLVFSGINNGFNTGQFVAYSGTLGAVLEASAHGIPAVAFSTHAGDLGKLTDELSRVWAFFGEKKLLERHKLYNVNIAPGFSKCRMTREEPFFDCERFVPDASGLYLSKLDLSMWKDRKLDPSYDMEALFAGYCSITPLKVDQTDESILKQLS